MRIASLLGILSRCLKALVITKALRLARQVRVGSILDSTSVKSVVELFDKYYEISEYQEQAYEWWRENRFDVMLSLGGALPAFKHGETLDLTISVCYTMIFCVLNMPTGTVPITLVRKEEESYADCTQRRDIFWRYACTSMRGSEGLPVGVQISVLRWDDEKSLAEMNELEAIVAFDRLPDIRN